MSRSKIDPQDRAIKVLVGIIKSHQGLLGLVQRHLPPHTPVNLRQSDDAANAAGSLLNDLRLGEVKMSRWVPVATLWCLECGNNWEGNSDDTCSECGGECSDA